MKTKINELVRKIANLVDELEIANLQLCKAVNDFSDVHRIDWDRYDIYADASEDFKHSLNGIKSAVNDYIIFANKPF